MIKLIFIIVLLMLLMLLGFLHNLSITTKKLLPGNLWLNQKDEVILIVGFSENMETPYPIHGENLSTSKFFYYGFPGNKSQDKDRLVKHIGDNTTHPEYFL